jgi:hypothetical protein
VMSRYVRPGMRLPSGRLAKFSDDVLKALIEV